MADPLTTGLVVAGTLGVAKRAEDFIAAISGHPGESLGTFLGNIANRRLKNAETVLGKSHLILLDIGVEPGEVPFNIAQPVLEAASLQESGELQDVWANLLANAADPRQISPVLPLFPSILKELSPREVKFLDALYDDSLSRTTRFNVEQTGADAIYGIGDFLNVYERAELSRTGRITQQLPNEPSTTEHRKEMDEFWIMLDVVRRQNIVRGQLSEPHQGNRRTSRDLIENFHLSDLGIAFIKACRRPSK